MEEDEMEMDAEELQMWVRDQVEKAELISPALLQKYDELHRLLEGRQNQTKRMLQLCQSLTACENLAKELYSGLGWEYEVLDSDEGNKPPSNGHTLPSSASSENLSSPSPGGQTTQLPKTQKTFEDQKVPLGLKEKAVVVLRRLSRSQLAKFIKVQNPPVLQNGKGDGDDLREPEVDSNDEEFQIPDNMTQKKRKIHHKNQNLEQRPVKRIRTDVVDKTGREAQKIPSPRVSLRIAASSHATKDRERQSETAKTAAAAAARRSEPARPRSKPEKTRTPPATVEKTLKGGEDNKGRQAASASSPAGNQTAGVASAKSQTKVLAKTPPEELTPNTSVLARKTGLHWELGKITKIVSKGDGGVKYKINFDQKGKRLVSGHHMAFKSVAKVDQLDIGSRVVVQRGEKYLPGILGEVPSRKNRMRFLVFTDDGAAVYVGLPLLHVVCRPLEDPLDDIQDKDHWTFMKQYLQDWPFPPQSQYKVGEVMKAEHRGTQQDCKVLLIDSSLLKVVFQSDGHTEWIYRGSLRLEHMLKLRRWMMSKNKKKT
ncbi:histone-lysine N-methyltransferase SETDB1-B isoform X2 [Oryzias latipes]|uniref:histone-lysine N-methyltransferase SETDB1-B isoform X2 n=1 Tax=Oryzias latipes TaxID=8090 RepID=UPI000CE1DDF6|nr:histone-lysine N-methyltransferase SETDB1-B isoform X2 [Oryzias latipes]